MSGRALAKWSGRFLNGDNELIAVKGAVLVRVPSLCCQPPGPSENDPMDGPNKLAAPCNASTDTSQTPPDPTQGLRGRRTVLAPPEKSTRLLEWIDSARKTTWPIERNLLIVLAVMGFVALLAIRGGLLSP
jgi:hypothetical protein